MILDDFEEPYGNHSCRFSSGPHHDTLISPQCRALQSPFKETILEAKFRRDSHGVGCADSKEKALNLLPRS